jgi:hypothetical protein
LTLSAARTLPAAQQQPRLLLASDEGGQDPSGGAGDAPAHHAGLNHAIELDRTRDTLERLRAEILDNEPTGDELIDCGADDHRVALGSGLNARGHVGCITEHVRAFVVGIADHYRPAVNSNPCGQSRKPLCLAPRI